ncbi:hypothetical protein SH661x_001228 [Planctomicrobium sp. SH661]|uniref:hypothetical protein n=1 Tax=Planctomicrobium sp. SH661 TaxID=3448124 RepID=UPI003F5B3F1E
MTRSPYQKLDIFLLLLAGVLPVGFLVTAVRMEILNARMEDRLSEIRQQPGKWRTPARRSYLSTGREWTSREENELELRDRVGYVQLIPFLAVLSIPFYGFFYAMLYKSPRLLLLIFLSEVLINVILSAWSLYRVGFLLQR